jgi:GTP-binding protein
MPPPLHSVAIVGRPNVGKSSLLNRVAGYRISIVEPTAGVTRDRVVIPVEHGGRVFELVDTGGIGLVDEVRLKDEVEAQIEKALAVAAVVVFLMDAKSGITPGDRLVADKLRRLKLPVVMAANKAESQSDEATGNEAYGLGMGDVTMISAVEGFGITDLLDRVVEALPPLPRGAEETVPETGLKIAVVGKRNSGKSTLINAWAQEDRVIVSEMPGTTRDAVDVHFELDGESFTAIDTAGLRRKHSVQDAIEFFSLKRAQTAILRADVVLLLFDMREPVSQVDKSLTQVILENCKPCVIGGNMLDLGQESEPAKWQKYIKQQLKGLHFAPVLFLSAKEGIHLKETLGMLKDLAAQAREQVSTPDLNKVLQDARRRQMPASGKMPKLYYGTQVGTMPPRVLVFVNDPKLFRGNYDRYLQNCMRAVLPWKEIPIQVHYRRREGLERGKDEE